MAITFPCLIFKTHVYTSFRLSQYPFRLHFLRRFFRHSDMQLYVFKNLLSRQPEARRDALQALAAAIRLECCAIIES